MDDRLEAHYVRSDDLVADIEARLRRSGRDPGDVTADELASLDEFHVRGRSATLEVAERLGVGEGSCVLDVGCGLGGAARAVADRYACRVVGVDLSSEFCRAASVLSAWLALEDRVAFVPADATGLPFRGDRFDAAMSLHTGMNVVDKDAMYREIHRVLRPGAAFVTYDVVQGQGGPVRYPVPWATGPDASHLVTMEEMTAQLGDAGFDVVAVEDSSDEGLAWFTELRRRTAESGPPAVGFDVFLGPEFSAMADNVVENLAEQRIRTATVVCRA